AERRASPVLPRTIWYMGAKARVIPGFLERVLEEEVPAGGTVVDLMSGTGVVAAFCADRWSVIANDVQAYAQAIARSLIEHDPGAKEGFLRSVDPRRDLEGAYERNVSALEDLYAPALAHEAQLLESFEDGDSGDAWLSDYRAFLEEPGSAYEGPAGPVRAAPRGGPYGRAAALLSEASLAAYRQDPGRRPACLVTAYYANIYFGLRQAIAIDSLRAAIDELDPRAPHAEAKRAHYLSALLHAASISTSGTSHFAQPRHLTKASEVRAMAARRLIGVRETFEGFSREILETVERTNHRAGNRALCRDYHDLTEGTGAGARFAFPGGADLVYLDPPYTKDHYSRFYHVLEVLTRYDYPELETDARGRIVRGRYPRLAVRFQSGFTSPSRVEDEFRRVVLASAGSGAKLVVSYSWPTGLLLKEYAVRRPGEDPVRRLEDLCREGYGEVSACRKALLHSGQGDKNRRIEELLVVCRGPRG
ncbi:MAG: DNA adenine methylase, partial [Planctomycetes bacterium]|nr:DNA adenine methylase [Planctomycetota bacterium]